MRTAFVMLLLLTGRMAAIAQTPPVSATPKPFFQGDFFGEMPRAFGTIVAVEKSADKADGRRALLVKLERDGKQVRVPISADTEIHFRDSWGELDDYFPGQRVMLFMYVDDKKQWTYPRAVQDEIHVSARHGWFARVLKIDAASHTYVTSRAEKNEKGEVTRTIENTYIFAPDVKVWKGESPAGIEGLQVGDEVIQQQVERDGKLTAVEILDRKGDDAVRIAQDARHRKDQERLGLPAYVTDTEPVSGSLLVTVAWSGSERARELKPGQVVALTPEGTGEPFSAAVCSIEPVDTRQRIQLLVNARVTTRLALGQPLRLFLPGTGPTVPTGRSSAPSPK